MKKPKNELDYIAEQVKNHDPDRFLWAMLMPDSVRHDLWTLFAFNYEIAKTREVVTETTLGLIRLQWWRDALSAIYEGGDVPQHEVVKPLQDVIEKHDLPREWFDSLIYAREFDLEDVLPANKEGLYNYADYTSVPLLKLAAKICGENPDHDALPAIARGYAIAGLLRSVVFHAEQGRCYLPEDELRVRNLEPRFFQNGIGASLKKDGFLESMASIVKEITDEAIEAIPKTKLEDRFLETGRRFAKLHLKQIKGLKYDSFDPRIAMQPPFFHFRLLLNI